MTRVAPIPDTVTLHVPFRIVKRGGRKEMQLPEGVRPDCKADNTLVKALARAFRWKRMLESGEFSSISELAETLRLESLMSARTAVTALSMPRFRSIGFMPAATAFRPS